MHIHLAVFRNLPEARRRAVGLSMHVQRLEDGRGALRWISRGAFGHVAEAWPFASGVRSCAQIGPALHASRPYGPLPAGAGTRRSRVYRRAWRCRRWAISRQSRCAGSACWGRRRLLQAMQRRRLVGTRNEEGRAKDKYSASQCHERELLLASVTVMAEDRSQQPVTTRISTARAARPRWPIRWCAAIAPPLSAGAAARRSSAWTNWGSAKEPRSAGTSPDRRLDSMVKRLGAGRNQPSFAFAKRLVCNGAPCRSRKSECENAAVRACTSRRDRDARQFGMEVLAINWQHHAIWTVLAS